MCFRFLPDLSNESVNFVFVWLISGVVPEFSEIYFCSDKLSYVFRKAERGVNYPSGRGSRDHIRNYVDLAQVPARVFRIKITEKGFVAMIEICVQFNSINGAVWRSVNTRHRDFSVVSYLKYNRCIFKVFEVLTMA
ncbi:hypothetical protein TNCV_1574871 [Trichonephila clavipes]|nr:hypothetical protein TNCV_1574871 [Trichonephila clavipes]